MASGHRAAAPSSPAAHPRRGADTHTPMAPSGGRGTAARERLAAKLGAAQGGRKRTRGGQAAAKVRACARAPTREPQGPRWSH